MGKFQREREELEREKRRTIDQRMETNQNMLDHTLARLHRFCHMYKLTMNLKPEELGILIQSVPKEHRVLAQRLYLDKARLIRENELLAKEKQSYE